MRTTPFEMGKLPEDVLTYIPGHCFIDLLKSLNDNIVIEGRVMRISNILMLLKTLCKFYTELKCCGT